MQKRLLSRFSQGPLTTWTISFEIIWYEFVGSVEGKFKNSFLFYIMIFYHFWLAKESIYSGGSSPTCQMPLLLSLAFLAFYPLKFWIRASVFFITHPFSSFSRISVLLLLFWRSRMCNFSSSFLLPRSNATSNSLLRHFSTVDRPSARDAPGRMERRRRRRREGSQREEDALEEEREREAEEEGEGGCVWVQRKVGDEFKKQRAWST